MWGSFKAAFAATVGVLLAYGLIQKVSSIDAKDIKEGADWVKEKADEATGAWKESRKISDPPDRGEMHVN